MTNKPIYMSFYLSFMTNHFVIIISEVIFFQSKGRASPLFFAMILQTEISPMSNCKQNEFLSFTNQQKSPLLHTCNTLEQRKTKHSCLHR